MRACVRSLALHCLAAHGCSSRPYMLPAHSACIAARNQPVHLSAPLHLQVRGLTCLHTLGLHETKLEGDDMLPANLQRLMDCGELTLVCCTALEYLLLADTWHGAYGCSQAACSQAACSHRGGACYHHQQPKCVLPRCASGFWPTIPCAP